MDGFVKFLLRTFLLAFVFSGACLPAPVFAAAPAATGRIANVDFIHKYIAQKWGITVPPNAAANIQAMANAEYLLCAIDRANQVLNQVATTDYCHDSNYAQYITKQVVNDAAVQYAVDNLIKQLEGFNVGLGHAAQVEDGAPDWNLQFSFQISASGTFYIFWGDGAVDAVVKANTNNTTYSHTYAADADYTITIAGKATGYNPNCSSGSGVNCVPMAAISFANSTGKAQINSISGDLGAIFPILDASGSLTATPRFANTFYQLTYWTGPIPNNLFAGLSGTVVPGMFYGTFQSDYKLGGPIPGALFAGLSGAPAANMFRGTFAGDYMLTGSIPGGLFAGIAGSPDQGMFYETFFGCSGLDGAIPGNLFAGVSGKPAVQMFMNTFYGCSSLSGAIPGNLFAGVSGPPVQSMFNSTFMGCANLSGAIPGTLFSGISGGPAFQMFYNTFFNCSGLSGSIPSGLFAGVSGTPAEAMFSGTFYGCTGLSGSISSGLFAGINGAPAKNMFNSTFQYCDGLTGPIPAGLFGTLSGAPAESMFLNTFANNSGLTGGIPGNLFAGVSGAPAKQMFNNTFVGCTGLSGIGDGLFNGISGAEISNMFANTFNGCIGLSGPSATSNGQYLYQKWPSATTDGVGGCYYDATGLDDYAVIPAVWR